MRSTAQAVMLLALALVALRAHNAAATAPARQPQAGETPTSVPPPAAAAHTPVRKIGSDEPLVVSDGLRIYGMILGPSNAYLIETKQGVTLVDAGMPNSARKVERKLEAIARPGELCQIFITHAHVDHYGAAAALRKSTGAPIIVHEDDAEPMALGRTVLGSVRNWEWTRLPLPVVERMIKIQPTPADRTVTNGEVISNCGLDATVLSTPGHTPGSASLLVRDPSTGYTYAFVGDLLSTTGGLKAQSSYAQDWSQISLSVDELRAVLPQLVFPGHGSNVITQSELVNIIVTGPAAH